MAVQESTGDFYPEWDDRIQRYRDMMLNNAAPQLPYIGSPLPGQMPYIGDPFDAPWKTDPNKWNTNPQPWQQPITYPIAPPGLQGFPGNPGPMGTRALEPWEVAVEALKNRAAELELKVMQLITILDYITGVESGKRNNDLLQEGGDKV